MKNKLKRIIPLCVLISAFVFTTLIFSTTYAKFTSELGAFGSVDAAKFELTLKNEEQTLKFNESGTSIEKEELNYEFSLVSNSEVAVGYSVNLEFNNALPANVSLTMGDGTKSQEIKCNGSQTEFTCEGCDCAIGETAKLTLTVTVEYVTMENGEYRLIDFSEFSDEVIISVIAEQKMPTK